MEMKHCTDIGIHDRLCKSIFISLEKIYCSDLRQERNDRLMTVHTSVEPGDVQ